MIPEKANYILDNLLFLEDWFGKMDSANLNEMRRLCQLNRLFILYPVVAFPKATA